MASFTYSQHANTVTKLPQKVTSASGDAYARYFLFYTPNYISRITSMSISYSITKSGSGGYNVRMCWGNTTTPGPEKNFGYDDISDSNKIIMSNPATSEQTTSMKNKFNRLNQYIIIRVGITNAVTVTINSFTITANGTELVLNSISAGDPITVDNMSALKTYIDERAQGTSATRYTITLPTAGNAISASDWSTFITKANALSYVSGLTAPSQYAAATAAYYNNIVTKLKG